ncbi:putative major intrinsic protein [Helianthus anomalus]
MCEISVTDSLIMLLRPGPTRNSCKTTLNPKGTIVSTRILRMIHDPDPGALLRITICQRNKDHLLGHYVRIIGHKNPALTIAPKI